MASKGFERGTINVINAIMDGYLKPGDSIEVAGVKFWKDSDGPWAGELSFDPHPERWDVAAVLEGLPA